MPKQTEIEHGEIIQGLENALGAAHQRCSVARTALFKAQKKVEAAVVDYQAQWPRITPEENIRSELARSQEMRMQRKCQGRPLDGPAVTGRHGPSALDHIAASQRGHRQRPPGSADFRRGSYAVAAKGFKAKT